MNEPIDKPDKWERYEGGTASDATLDLEYGRLDEDSPPPARASVGWDGCVRFYSYGNGVDPATASPEDLKRHSDSFHICDVEDHIRTLQALVAKAREHFGPDWPR